MLHTHTNHNYMYFKQEYIEVNNQHQHRHNPPKSKHEKTQADWCEPPSRCKTHWLIGSSFGKVTWSSIAHLVIMIPTAQKNHTLVGGFNQFEKHESKMGASSSPIFGVIHSKIYLWVATTFSVHRPAYPESARLLKDVNKSSLATPGEACMAFELSKKTTFHEISTYFATPSWVATILSTNSMVATISGNSFIAWFLDIWVNFILLHHPQWLSFFSSPKKQVELPNVLKN